MQEISTRSVDDLVKAQGMTVSAKSQVSRLREEVNVGAFLERPLPGNRTATLTVWQWPRAPANEPRLNGRSRGIADVARRRERCEEISKADPQR